MNDAQKWWKSDKIHQKLSKGHACQKRQFGRLEEFFCLGIVWKLTCGHIRLSYVSEPMGRLVKSTWPWKKHFEVQRRERGKIHLFQHVSRGKDATGPRTEVTALSIFTWACVRVKIRKQKILLSPTIFQDLSFFRCLAPTPPEKKQKLQTAKTKKFAA